MDWVHANVSRYSRVNIFQGRRSEIAIGILESWEGAASEGSLNGGLGLHKF